MSTRKSKILFIHHVGYLGGAGLMLENTIRTLDRGRFELIVLCPPGDMVKRFREAGAQVDIAPRKIWQWMHISGYWRPVLHPGFIWSILMIVKDLGFWAGYIRRSGAEIVHLNAITLAPLAWSARCSGAKVVCCVQETSTRGWTGLRTALLRRFLSSSMDAVIFISEFDRDSSGCRAPIVDVVPNWVDLNEFNRSISPSGARAKLGLHADAKTVLFLGGLDKVKGTLPLLRAMTRLRDVEALVLVIAGGGFEPSTPPTFVKRIKQRLRLLLRSDYPAMVRQALKDSQLSKHVRILGLQHEVVDLYAASDVIVFPSTAPHQARPVIEAGAMGKPVVISDFPNTREFVSDGVNGLLSVPGSPDSLAQCIRQVVTDPDLARRLGEANYMMTCKKHNSAVNSVRMARIYEQLTG